MGGIGIFGCVCYVRLAGSRPDYRGFDGVVGMILPLQDKEQLAVRADVCINESTEMWMFML